MMDEICPIYRGAHWAVLTASPWPHLYSISGDKALLCPSTAKRTFYLSRAYGCQRERSKTDYHDSTMSTLSSTSGVTSNTTTLRVTSTTTSTTSSTLLDEDIAWYDFIGPVVAVLFILILVAACFKCIFEICDECSIFKSCCRRREDAENRDDEGRRSLSINIDLPPRYSTTVITNIDLENNVILETDAERISREKQTGRLKGIEEKLPTYLEIIEEDRTKNHQNPAFEGDDDGAENGKSTNNDNEEDLDAISVITETNLPPPPPYQSPF